MHAPHKLSIIALFAAFLVSNSHAEAEVILEKCKVVNKDGRGLIKANKADCKAATHSCAGQNKGFDSESWIFVPRGQCAKINADDYSGITQEIKDKIEGAK